MEEMDLNKLYSAEKAEKDTVIVSDNLKDHVDNDKILTLLSHIKSLILGTKIQSKTNAYVPGYFRYTSHLSRGEQALLTKLKYKVSYETDHGDSWYEIKW